MIPILDVLAPIVSKVLDFIPDPQKKAEAQLKLTEELNRHSEEILKAVSAVDTAQIGVNQEEAKSPSLFIAGWRPAVAWICGAGLLWETILRPSLGVLCVFLKHPEYVGQFPPINTEVLITMLGYLLGFGGMRSWEKKEGIHQEH